MDAQMPERYSDLDPERANRLLDLLQTQSVDSLDRLSEIDAKIAQTTFLTNGGGAAAMLAYMGGGADRSGSLALLSFCIGLVCTGVSLRFLRSAWYAIHMDVRRRMLGFANNQLTVKECGTSAKPVPDWGERAEWVGWVGQAAFVVGVILGAFEILC
ncbi:MAG: hypothetical protein H6979_02895 [Chromatiales bacterium]|nr:hypothetical protein [Chromatiales bacterium]